VQSMVSLIGLFCVFFFFLNTHPATGYYFRAGFQSRTRQCPSSYVFLSSEHIPSCPFFLDVSNFYVPVVGVGS